MPIDDKQQLDIFNDLIPQDLSTHNPKSESKLDLIWQDQRVSKSDFDLISKRHDFSKAVESPLIYSSQKVNQNSVENDLRDAVLYDDTTLLRKVIKEGGDLDKPIYYHSPRNLLHNYYRAPLFIALSENNYWVSKALLKAGANPNVIEKNTGLTPIFPAIKNYIKAPSKEGLAIISMLLDYKADPQYFNKNRDYLTNPINYVSQHLKSIATDPFNFQHQDHSVAKLIKFLINHGANVNSNGLLTLYKKPAIKVRPLKWSFVLGLSQTMLLLIASGAELNLDITNLTMTSNPPNNRLGHHQMQKNTFILYKKVLSTVPNHRIFAQDALNVIRKMEEANYVVDEYLLNNIEKVIGRENEIISLMKQNKLNAWLSKGITPDTLEATSAQSNTSKQKRDFALSDAASNDNLNDNSLSQLPPLNKKIKQEQYITPSHENSSSNMFFSESEKYISPSKKSGKIMAPFLIKENQSDADIDTAIYYQR